MNQALTYEQEKRLEDLRRRLANARRRATFWSGTPSFRRGARFMPRARNRGSRPSHGEQYELALCDIDSLATSIEELTGRKVKRSDPKKEFAVAFGNLMGAIAQKKQQKVLPNA